MVYFHKMYMVVTDKNELQAQKEPILPDEEELYDRYARN